MSYTWGVDEPPLRAAPIGLRGRILAVTRGALCAIVLLAGLAATVVLRPVERIFFGLRRPLTGRITRAVCRALLAVIGIGYRIEGPVMTGPGALVANHTSWLDILVLNAGAPLYFVAKDDVAHWPGIGTLAKVTGTLFIRRDRAEARAQAAQIAARLEVGHRLLIFPEGTSTDGCRVLPFRPALFEAFRAAPLRATLQIQPMSVVYEAPPGADPRFYGWWGDMDLAPSLLRVLGTARQGRVRVIRHAPLSVSDHADRKSLARASENAVRAGLEQVLKALPAR